MADMALLEAQVEGQVQGVFFRSFVNNHASRLNLTGYVANLPDGRSMEVFAEGERGKLQELLQLLRKGPTGARVERVNAKWSAFEGRFPQFKVRY